ncbi:MAG: DUF4159 domain-containing protein [Gemmatimonadota bacterium]
MATRFRVLTLLLVVASLAATSSATAQRRGFGGACSYSYDAQNYFVSPFFRGNPGYDGRVTFARIKYQGSYECGGEGPGWSHDYPRTEANFMRIVRELTSMRPFIERGPIVGSALVRLDDPEIFSYPIAYLSEPGGWMMSDAEIRGLQRYIKQGGFIIFDDIEGDPNPDYRNLIAQWRRAFPNSVPVKLTNEHPIFNTFFAVDLSKIPSKARRVPAEYMGIFEDNDPKKRMVAIIDNYADIGEYIEFSDEGFNMVPANEAYKLWVNYFVYALTH